jgi:hypothetical protein
VRGIRFQRQVAGLIDDQQLGLGELQQFVF